MPDQLYTRCPSCRTVFRVTPAQLAVRDGQVRCGHCQSVFDGNAQRISLSPLQRPPEEPMDEDLLGPPTITLRNASDLRSAAEPVPTRAQPSASPGAPASPAPPSREIAYEERFSWARQHRRRRANAFYAFGIPLLLVLLAGQALFHFRDLVAARWPATRPALARACAVLGCVVQPLRDVAGLSIDASDLQADPAHRGLLVLTATLRNRASWPIAYPHLELTLTDAQDQVVVRRALQPREYLPPTSDITSGMAANGELPIRLFLDASATTQAGYRLYLFYP